MASRIVDFEEQYERLQREALARLADSHAKLAAQFMRDLQAEKQDCLQELERQARKYQSAPSLPPAPTSVERTVGDVFGKALLEPTVPIRVSGITLYVHRCVLQRMPFFAAMLDGEWSDASSPDIDLPCSPEEFLLLLRRFYTDEPLGSVAIPVSDCAAVLRIAAAAAMLLVEDKLPELADLLLTSISTKEDAVIAAQAIGALPASLAMHVKDLCATAALPAESLPSLIGQASTEEARGTATAILRANRGLIQAECLRAAVSAALQTVLQRSDYSGNGAMVKWLMLLCQEHLCAADVSAIFQSCSAQYIGCGSGKNCHPIDAQPRIVELRSAYMKHLLQCAKRGDEIVDLVAGLAACGSSPGRCEWITRSFNDGLFAWTSQDADALVNVVQAAMGQRSTIAAQLVQAAPFHLVKVFSSDMVKALGADANMVIDRLGSDPSQACAWASPEKLKALPLATRKKLCVQLSQRLGSISPEVRAIVEDTLV